MLKRLLILCQVLTKWLSVSLFIKQFAKNKVLTKPLSVELTAAVLGFGVRLLGSFRIAG